MPVRGNTWTMYDAVAARNRNDKYLNSQIKKIYKEVADEVSKKAEQLKGSENVSDILRQQYLRDLEKQLNIAMENANGKIATLITNGVTDTTKAVVDEAKNFAAAAGIVQLSGAYSNVQENVIKNIIYGNVYETKTPLSERIWSSNKKQLDDINKVIAAGVAGNKSTYDIAKDLEKYVDPSAKKDWSWSKVYPGTNKKIDYNAQRLARTMVQHAYQQAFVDTTYKNPFVSSYMWLSALVERTCAECEARHGMTFKKDALPFDHPNGLCTVVANLDGDMDSISQRIADWYNSPPGTYPEIDAYAADINQRIPFKTSKVVGGSDVPKLKANPKVNYAKEYEKALKGKSSFYKELKDAGKVEEFMNTFKSYTPEQQKAMLETLKSTGIYYDPSARASYYSPLNREIIMSKVKTSDSIGVLYHELGHALDAGMSNRLKASEGLLSHVLGDIDKYIQSNSKYNGYAEAFIDPTSNGKNKPQQVLNTGKLLDAFKRDFDLRSSDTKGIQDALRGLSDGKVAVAWGHSLEYYKRKEYGKEVVSELFAQYTSDLAYNKAGAAATEKLFPKFCEEYKKIVSEYGKSLK